MKGIIYTRVSSDEQVKGTSLDSQEEQCRAYCKDKGIEVLAIYREEGVSAKSADRAEFLRSIEYCRKNKGKIQAFIVAKVDRFARNTEDHFYIRKVLLDYGVSLHSVSEPIGNSPVGKLIETMLAGTSEFDNAIRKQRCSDGMLSRLNQGIYPWHPPIGYKSAFCNRLGEKKIRPDPKDEILFPLIQRALKEYAKGLYSQAELARALDKWGLEDIRHKKTNLQFIDRILGRYLKFYSGILVNPWTGEEIRGLHIPMITPEEAYSISLIRSGKFKNVKRNRYNPDFPLRRTAMCESCTNPLTGSTPRGNGGKYPSYHCYNKKCPMYGKTIPKDELEKKFKIYLEEITPREDFLAVFRATVLDLWKEKGQTFEDEGKKYEKRLIELEVKRKKIFEMNEDGTYSKEEFVERKEGVENELATIKISLSETRIEQFDIEGALIYATTFITNLGRMWFDLSPQLQPRFQRLVFPKGIPYKRGQGFGTTQLGFIYEVNRNTTGEKSQVVCLRGFEPLTSSSAS
jgi:DNA invertase Pin-like site-specific DNA recombinase